MRPVKSLHRSWYLTLSCAICLSLTLLFFFMALAWSEPHSNPSMETTGTRFTLTPVSELVSQEPGKPSQASPQPASTVEAEPTDQVAEPPAPIAEESATIPAVDTAPAKVRKNILLDNRLVKKFTQKVSYTPLAAIAIFPVVQHHQSKAFGDLPILFANEFAHSLEQKAPGTKVLNPVYTVEELRIRGLQNVYNKVIDFYIKARRPEPKALSYLLKELSADGRQIQRVAFVEVDLDMSHPTKTYNIADKIKGWTTDSLPKEMHYFVKSRIQVFDTSKPEQEMIWTWSWNNSIKANTFVNVTPSVFQDSDSVRSFGRVSRYMSREISLIVPKNVYLEPHPETDASVQGEVVPK
jgi:hypothetical protein